MITCQIFGVTDWMQASAALVITVLTFLTLLVLIRYAADTKRIAEASVAQTENSQMPCLVVVMYEREGGWAIENQGAGPALNIRFTGFDGGNRPAMKTLPPLAAKAHRFAHNDISEVIVRWPREFRINYESLSGTKYLTTLNMEGEMQTQFHRPAVVPPDIIIGEFLRSFLQFMKWHR